MTHQSSVPKPAQDKLHPAIFVPNLSQISGLLLNGMYTAMEGVAHPDGRKVLFALTNPERTLLDCTVRPRYAGGAFSVLEMYKRGIKKKISTTELIGILKTIPFTYPYHQSVGFYLQKTGYSGNALEELRSIPMDYDFYLDYAIEEKEYSKEWRIYYPKGL